jgi:hypothetical protein
MGTVGNLNADISLPAHAPDPAIAAWHRFNVARQMLQARKFAPEQCEDMVAAWRNMESVTPATEEGEILKRQAIALHTEHFSNLGEFLPPRPLTRILADLTAATKIQDAIDPDDEPACDAAYIPRDHQHDLLVLRRLLSPGR